MVRQNLWVTDQNCMKKAWSEKKILRYKSFLIIDAYEHSAIILQNIPSDVLKDVMYIID
jgi:hypothetical protein